MPSPFPEWTRTRQYWRDVRTSLIVYAEPAPVKLRPTWGARRERVLVESPSPRRGRLSRRAGVRRTALGRRPPWWRRSCST